MTWMMAAAIRVVIADGWSLHSPEQPQLQDTASFR
jgi:hypothetical protein